MKFSRRWHNTTRRSMVAGMGIAAAWLACFNAVPSLAAQSGDAPPAAIEGKLGVMPSGAPFLKTSDKQYTLAGRSSYMLRTLADKRLQNQEIRLEGQRLPGGAFQVWRIFTIHKGKLYRVQYFCETCNIVSYQPGRCVCCQQPTELQEVPVDGGDTIVIH